MLQSYKGFTITLKALAIFTSVMFYGPVFVLFYEKVGLSFADITKLKVIIFITITLLEVPLGSYSDIYGIKKTIKMGIMFFILSFFITAFSNHFFVFAVSSIIFGIASALISGCTQILLFDFLKQQGKSDSFTKENGSLVFYQQVSSALSLLAGSFVFGIDYRAPYIVTAVFFFVGYAFVSEIDFDCNQYSGPVRGGRKVYLETLKKSFELLKDRNIFFVLFLSSIFNAATMATFDMIQVALKKVSIPSKFFGTVYFGFIIISALGTRFAYLIQTKFSKSWKTQSISLVLFQALAIALLSFVEKNAIAVLLVFSFLEFMNGLMIIFFDSLNKLVVDNSIRMTMSSIQALINALIKSMFFLMTGIMVTSYGFGKASLTLSVTLVCLLAVVLVYQKRNKLN